MGIVEEIIGASKPILEGILTDYAELDYEFILPSNSERSLDKRYGFTPGPCTFIDGSAIGFTTIDQVFRLTFTETYQNQDCDEALRAVLLNQYALVQNVLKELQKSKLALPTVGNRVMLIKGISVDEVEIIEENSGEVRIVITTTADNSQVVDTPDSNIFTDLDNNANIVFTGSYETQYSAYDELQIAI